MESGELSVEERVRLTAGRDLWSTQPVERADVPSLVLTDGPHGVRMQRTTDELELGDAVPATCFPTGSALAASWDVELLAEVGVALGEEARAQKVSVLLGPGTTLKRTPLCGRNFEYFSEDPLLSAALAAAWVRGVQSTGVAASLKHFAANNQENRRYSIDALVDERALREIYLASFERAVREARPATVMAAYNQLNGAHASEHRELLTTVLREEWGFDGLVVSDWGAVFDRVPALTAGCDLQMPGFGGQGDAELVAAVRSGRLPEEALDAAVARILRLAEATAGAREPGRTYDAEAHHALARRAAADGAVLLKNDAGLLPLPTSGTVAVVGAFAEVPRYQGAGSSLITPHRLDDALSAIRATVDRVSYAPGYPRTGDRVDPALLAEAQSLAASAEVVVAFVGLPESYETEGVDRLHLGLPRSHDALVRAVAAVNRDVVVVLANGAPVEMPWVAQVPAVLEAYLGGQAGGSAVADVLFGRSEPGGRLAETFPHRWSDNPVSGLPAGPRQVEYRESLYVGYRYYDTAAADVLFPFGHGLGYTTVEYSELTLTPPRVDAAADLPVTVAVTVTNTGGRRGSEVVQLYLHAVRSSVFRPEQELKAFAKVRLEPGESRRVELGLDRRSFAVWDRQRHRWAVEPGLFEVRVGASSRDIRATGTVEVTTSLGGDVPTPDGPELAPYRDLSRSRGFDRSAFQALYGRPLPDNRADVRGSYTLDTPLGDMGDSLVARLLLAGIRRAAVRLVGDDEDSPMATMVQRAIPEMPLRMLPLISRGAVSATATKALLAVLNGRPLAGATKVLAAFVSNRQPR